MPDMSTSFTFADLVIESVLLDIVDEMVASSEHISHHTGLSATEAGYLTELVLKEENEVVLPGFDMKSEKQPVGPNGEMRGGLLTGPYAQSHTNKHGKHYAIIPINPDIAPSPFHKQDALNPDLYTSANMLADKAGIEVAMQFLLGAGANPEQVHEWQTERFQGAKGDLGNRVVFRTVSEESPAASWWYPPRKVSVSVDMNQVLAEIDVFLEGGL